MSKTQAQIVGRFVFDETDASRSRDRHPQAIAADAGERSEILAFFVAIAIATVALWWLGF